MFVVKIRFMAKGWQRWAIAAVVLGVVVLSIVLIIQAVDAGSSSAAAPQPRKVGTPRFAGSELERDNAEIQQKMNDLITRRKRRAGTARGAVPVNKLIHNPEKSVRKAANDPPMGVLDLLELSCGKNKDMQKAPPSKCYAAVDLASVELAKLTSKN